MGVAHARRCPRLGRGARDPAPGDVVAILEAGTGGELHDLFVFDLVWAVFLIGSLATLVVGVAALIAGLLRQAPGLKRYATCALAYAAVAVALLFAVARFEL